MRVLELNLPCFKWIKLNVFWEIAKFLAVMQVLKMQWVHVETICPVSASSNYEKNCIFIDFSNKSLLQVSLAIRGGYVPEKSSTANTKTAILSLIYRLKMLRMTVFPCYSRFLSPWIVKTANTKPANNEGRLYYVRSHGNRRESKMEVNAF